MGRPASYDRNTALTSAMNLFWRQGYQGTSLKDLENELGMRPGSIYAAFQSKEALFRECLALYDSNIGSYLEQLAAQDPSPIAGLSTCLLSLAGLSENEDFPPCMLIKTMLEATRDDTGSEIFGGASRDLFKRMQLIVLQQVEAAQKAGELQDTMPSNVLARRLHTASIGIRIQIQVSPDNAETRDALRGDLFALLDLYRTRVTT